MNYNCIKNRFKLHHANIFELYNKAYSENNWGGQPGGWQYERIQPLPQPNMAKPGRSELYFDSNAKDVVSGWLGSAEDDIDNLIRKSLYSTTSDSQPVNSEKLGHQVNNSKNVNIRDDLERRLLNKRKRQRGSDDANTKSHEGDDDDDGISKLNMITSKNSNKKAKSEPSKPQQGSQLSSTSNTTTIDTSPIAQDKPPSDYQSSAHESSFSTSNIPVPVKRKKTRSKQKNIRKDRRSDDMKPSHLQFGSKEYAGRPLTEETKRVLAIDESQLKKKKKKKKKNVANTIETA